MTTKNCDKYGFKTIVVGESKFIPGGKRYQARQMETRYVLRYPEMIHKDFILTQTADGLLVERVR